MDRPEQDKQLFVHMVAHSHTEMAFKKTPAHYYSGTRQDLQHASVSLILDNVFEQMMKKRWTKFTWAEIKYF